MITLEKLKVYAKHGGDADDWARNGSAKTLNNEEWNLIDSFIHDLSLANKGLLSQEYLDSFHAKLIRTIENEISIAYLKSLANKID